MSLFCSMCSYRTCKYLANHILILFNTEHWSEKFVGRISLGIVPNQSESDDILVHESRAMRLLIEL